MSSTQESAIVPRKRGRPKKVVDASPPPSSTSNLASANVTASGKTVVRSASKKSKASSGAKKTKTSRPKSPQDSGRQAVVSAKTISTTSTPNPEPVQLDPAELEQKVFSTFTSSAILRQIASSHVSAFKAATSPSVSGITPQNAPTPYIPPISEASATSSPLKTDAAFGSPQLKQPILSQPSLRPSPALKTPQQHGSSSASRNGAPPSARTIPAKAQTSQSQPRVGEPRELQGPKIAQGQNGKLHPKYKPAARRVLAIMVALPILIVTSYDLVRRSAQPNVSSLPIFSTPIPTVVLPSEHDTPRQ